MGRLRVKIKLQLFPDNIERLLLRAVCYAGIYDLQRWQAWPQALIPGQRHTWPLRAFYVTEFLKYKKENGSDIDIRKEQKKCPLLAFSKVFYVS